MKTYLGRGRRQNIVWCNTQYGRTAAPRLVRRECKREYSLDPVYVDSLKKLYDELGMPTPYNLHRLSEKDACGLLLTLTKKLRERRR